MIPENRITLSAGENTAHFARVAGALVNSLAFLMAGYSRSYALLAFAMVMGGLGGGTYHPVGSALISNLFKDRVGRAFGFIEMGASFGLFLGPFASGHVGEQYGIP